MEKILLIGGGGHCKVIIQAILLGKKYRIAGIIDVKEKVGKKILNFPITETDNDITGYFKKGTKYCFIAVGSIGRPELRMKLFNLVNNIGFKFPNIIHPASLISKFTKLGFGNYIAPGVIINAGAKIGNNCIINTGAIIDHDTTIDDFVHIAPGVAMSGGISIGRYSHIGTGTSISQDVKIGENTIIGAGSVVINSIGSNIIACGNPCREIKTNA